jgi:N-acetylmuramate 1-kinase
MVLPSRESQLQAFLQREGYGHWRCQLHAGDASFRKYWRIVRGNESLVLMDAPPPQENIVPFINICALLAKANCRVPALFAHDIAQGFLLLEDIGDASFTAFLCAQPAQEQTLYFAAVQALATLQRQAETAPLAPYDQAVYLREVALFADWFLPQIYDAPHARALKNEWMQLFEAVLQAVPLQQNVLVHRDYHADNLFWLANTNSVAMLDFQDALCGDAAYDLVSLLEDARRDVPAIVVQQSYDFFVKETAANADDFAARYALLGAQRNAKIIGIFVRLAVRDNKPHYLQYLPRVWGHFMGDLAHPSLRALHAWVQAHVPPHARGVITVNPALGNIA